MSLTGLLQDRLALTLSERLQQGGAGFCLRVDYLGGEDAERVCNKLRTVLSADGDEAYVLSGSPVSQCDISPERAIEIRNRKQLRLCLLVPVGVMDAAASSLTNAFASFDLAEFWKETSNDLLGELTSEIQPAVRRVLTTLRGSLAATQEQRVDFLAAVRANPTLRTVGLEMWRLGLIPDGGESDFVERLEKNQACVRELSRPVRAHSSPEERLQALRLSDAKFGRDLKAFFTGKRLRDSRSWLEALAVPSNLGRLTFEKWIFEEGEQSDLKEIEVLPLLNEEGVVEAYTKLRQSEAGAQPVAPVGAKAKVCVKWSCAPKGPANLSRWKAELIPSRDYYAENEMPTVDLPTARAAGKTRRVTIPLDIELSEEEPAVAVQVRIVGLDESGAELSSSEGIVVEGLSEEFWLTSEEIGEEPGSTKDKQATAVTLALGRLKAASELAVDELDEAPGQWNERDLHYYSVRFNGRYVVKLGLSPVLRRLEERAIAKHEELGCYRAEIESGGTLDVDAALEVVALNAISHSEDGKKFIDRRRDFFAALKKQEHRGLVETADWNDDVCKRARSYANSYVTLLSEIADRELLRQALRVDTLSLSITAAGRSEKSVVLSPTHPLRVLWYAAYTELLRTWESDLLKAERRERKKLLDFDLLLQVAPLNCPSFVPADDDQVLLFAQNLRFFWGVALPVDVQDPAKRIASVANALAIADDDTSLSDLAPDRVTNELHTYHEVHPYLETMRLNCINPGSSGFLADVLRRFYTGGTRYSSTDEEFDSVNNLPRLELFAHVHRPVPTGLPALADLQADLYDIQPRGRRQYFSPFFSVSVRAIEDAKCIPGGDVNLSMIFDMLSPDITPNEGEADCDSASFYGLLMRMRPEFHADEGHVAWRHRFHFPETVQVAKHPVMSAYTSSLLELHRSYLRSVATILGAEKSSWLPSVEVRLDEQQRDYVNVVHQQSDWVVTLDRFFDVEFFDAPQEKQLSDISKKYLLDYAPEFLEGLGHRMLVTTMHREEVEQILARAMGDLGFAQVEGSVGKVFDHLKTISGRLALRILGDDSRAREAVSLGVVAAYLKANGELQNSILIPVDAHPELFGPQRKRRRGEAALRCDLIQIRFLRNRLVGNFIEVKSRSAAGQSEELLNRIVDQIDATADVFDELFFSKEPQRIDHNLQRSRLATILRFYLRRAERYGLITSDDERKKLEEGVSRLETGIPDLRVERHGYVVNLQAAPQRPAKLRDTEIHFVTADTVVGAGLSAVGTRRTQLGSGNSASDGEEEQESDDSEQNGNGGAREPPFPAGPTPNQAVGDTDDESISELVPREEAVVATAPEVCEVELGATLVDQDPVIWKTGVKGSPHLFIIGIPGQGKSWTTTRILCDLHNQTLPAVVIDFHGQFADPEGAYVKVATPTVLDVAHGLPFSPFEAEHDSKAGTNSWQANCFAIAEIFEYVCQLGDIQRDVVYQALRDCYVKVGFESESPDRLPTVAEFQKRLEALEEERGVKNVVPRCRPLLEFGLFRSGANASEFGELLKRGLVVDVSGLGMETLQLAAGAFVLRKIYKDMFQWGEASRLRIAIVLDEAHRLAKDVTLPKIMKEGRKFGVAVIVASQGLSDFHPDVVGNAGTKVVFRTNYPMSKKVAGFVRAKKSVNLAEGIEQLEVGEAFVQTPEMNYCARVRMHPLQ